MSDAAALSRSQARLAAVQALYQMDLAETDLAAVIEEFKAHRLGLDAGHATAAQADPEHFERVLQGVVAGPARYRPADRKAAGAGLAAGAHRFHPARDPARRHFRAHGTCPMCRPGSSSASTSRSPTPSSRATSPRWSTACWTGSRASCAPASCPSGRERRHPGACHRDPSIPELRTNYWHAGSRGQASG